MKEDKLRDVLHKHVLWINGDDNGIKADLRFADLRSVDLRSADLRFADLRYANLSSADLSFANLRSADLSFANLSGVNGLLNPISWLRDNLKRNINGQFIVYKIFGFRFSNLWEIKTGAIITEVVNPNRTDECGCGINVATLEWCTKNNDEDKNLPIWECYIPRDAECSIVVPYNTDGKFRCGELIVGHIVDVERTDNA